MYSCPCDIPQQITCRACSGLVYTEADRAALDEPHVAVANGSGGVLRRTEGADGIPGRLAVLGIPQAHSVLQRAVSLEELHDVLHAYVEGEVGHADHAAGLARRRVATPGRGQPRAPAAAAATTSTALVATASGWLIMATSADSR